MNVMYKTWVKYFVLATVTIISSLSSSYAAAPTVGIVVSPSTIISGATSTVTFTFSEPVTGFDNSDITVGNGTISSVSSTDDTIWTATFTPNATMTSSTNVITVDNTGVMDIATNTAGSGTTDSNNYSVDTVLPTLSSVTIVSDNSNTSFAKPADTVTLSFSASESINIPDVTIKGHTVSVSGTGPYTALYTMQASDSEGTIPFTIDFTDQAGNIGTQVTTLTTGSNITFDKTSPNVPAITSIATDNRINNSEKSAVHFIGTAESGTTINVSLTDGTTTVSGSGTATGGNYDITIDTTTLNDGTTTPSVTATDVVGNVSATTSTPLVIKEITTPTLTSVSIASNNASTTLAKVGDIVTVSFTSSKAISTPTVTIDGQSATTTNTSENNWTATFVMTSDQPTGLATTSISFSDLSGNAGVIVSTTTDSSSVTFDKTQPTLSISMGSYSFGGGDSTLVTFTFSEKVIGFNNSDISADNGFLSTATSTDGGIVWTVGFTPNVGTSITTNIIMVGTGVIDLAGNILTSTTTSSNYIVNTLGALASGGGGGGGGGNSSTYYPPSSAAVAATTGAAVATTATTESTNANQGQVLGASVVNFTKDLKVGSRGSDVTELQKILIKEGLLNSEPTGYFGKATENALKKFQSKNGLPSNGKFGPLTRKLVSPKEKAAVKTAPVSTPAKVTQINVTSTKKTTTPVTSANTKKIDIAVKTVSGLPVAGPKVLGASIFNFKSDLHLKSQGEAVKELQKILISEGLLKGDPTGSFEKSTEDALKKWQTKKGLAPTGYFGPTARTIVNRH